MLTPRAHFEKDVRPPCQAYFADPTAGWRAKAAAQAINNFSEWTFLYYTSHDPARLQGATGLGQFKTKHASACREFRIVWDLAEAAKHRFLTTHLRSRIVTTSTGAWTDNNKTLEIIATGDQVDVIIGEAMEYWDKQI